MTNYKNAVYVIALAIALAIFAACQQPTGPITGPNNRNLPEIPKVLPYQYLSLAEIEEKLQALEKNYSTIVDVQELSDNQGLPYKTYEGRTLYAVKVSDNVAVDEDEPVGVFIAGQHAREWLAIAVGYYMLEHIVQSYYTDMDIRGMVDSTELWFVPVVNPDGYVYSYTTTRYWRKNRRDNGDDTFGVDLNRNWGYPWGYDDIGSSPRTSSEIYRGTDAFSEPETRAIRDLLLKNNPDVFIDYHSAAEMVLYPYGHADGVIADARTVTLAREYAQAVYKVRSKNYVVQPAYDLYLTNGDSIDYVQNQYQNPSILIELPPDEGGLERFAPPATEIEPTVEENLAGLFVAIEYIIEEAREEN